MDLQTISKDIESIKPKALDIFLADKGLDPVLLKIKEICNEFKGDASTEKGREEIRSFAHKVARSKTLIDGVGKDLVDDLKKQPKIVDAERKRARDFLDKLKDDVCLPLTLWEAKEQARIERNKAVVSSFIFELAGMSIEALDTLQSQVTAMGVYAGEFTEQAKDAKLLILAKIQAAKEAELNRQKEIAEQKRQQEIEIAERIAREKESAVLAERDRAEKEAQKRADEAAMRAMEAERMAALEAAAEAARKADVEHRRTINNEVLLDIIREGGIFDAEAKALVRAIASGKIRHIKINY